MLQDSRLYEPMLCAVCWFASYATPCLPHPERLVWAFHFVCIRCFASSHDGAASAQRRVGFCSLAYFVALFMCNNLIHRSWSYWFRWNANKRLCAHVNFNCRVCDVFFVAFVVVLLCCVYSFLFSPSLDSLLRHGSASRWICIIAALGKLQPPANSDQPKQPLWSIRLLLLLCLLLPIPSSCSRAPFYIKILHIRLDLWRTDFQRKAHFHAREHEFYKWNREKLLGDMSNWCDPICNSENAKCECTKRRYERRTSCSFSICARMTDPP